MARLVVSRELRSNVRVRALAHHQQSAFVVSANHLHAELIGR